MIAAASAVVAVKTTMDIVTTYFSELAPQLRTEKEINLRESIQVVLEIIVKYLAMWEQNDNWKRSSILKRLRNLKAVLFETLLWSPKLSYPLRVMSVLAARKISSPYCLRILQLPKHVVKSDENIAEHKRSRNWVASKFDQVFTILNDIRSGKSSPNDKFKEVETRYNLNKNDLFAAFDKLFVVNSGATTAIEYTENEIDEIDEESEEDDSTAISDISVISTADFAPDPEPEGKSEMA